MQCNTCTSVCMCHMGADNYFSGWNDCNLKYLGIE
jgi:hypothetical protein